jgi:hypothetical protein
VTQWEQLVLMNCGCKVPSLCFALQASRTLTDNVARRGFKRSKDRITLVFCANVTGSVRLRLTVINKSASPRAFGRTDPNTVCDWYSNKKAWMNREVRVYMHS